MTFCALTAHAASAPEPASNANTERSSTSLNASQQRKIDGIRAQMISKGIDPDSPQGQIVMRFSEDLVSNPAAAAQLRAVPHTGMGELIWKQRLSPDGRLRALERTKELVNSLGNGCDVDKLRELKRADSINKLPPRALQAMFDLIEILPSAKASQDDADTIGDRLDSVAEYATAFSTRFAARMKAKPFPFNECEELTLRIDTVLSMADPARRRMSLEFMKILGGRPTVLADVVTDPRSYLDEAFDSQALPSAMRTVLPADGSQHLPFSTITIDGEWAGNLALTSGEGFVYTITNRRNDGVITELLRTVNNAGATQVVDFGMYYGLMPLRNRQVTYEYATPMALFTDDAKIVAQNMPFQSGEKLSLPFPAPSYNGYTRQDCVFGKTKTASSVFPALTGSALEFQCDWIGTGLPILKMHGVWLPDYHVKLYLSAERGSDRSELLVHNITIR
jgi:hypothetical protein